MPVTGRVKAYARRTPVKHIEDFVERICSLEEEFQDDLILFRGQPCDEPLLPKLGRSDILKHITDIKTFESNIFRDFSKRYIPFSARVYENSWDLLAVGQHFGLPTRLLDWTESAMIALWFATEKKVKYHDHGVVWYFMPEDKDIINFEELDNDGVIPNPFTRRATKVFSPDYISERITAQSGWFTCHAVVNNRFVKLENQTKYKTKLNHWLIPTHAFPQIRRKLNRMGINASSVFPDLIGLSSYLKWKHLKADNSA